MTTQDQGARRCMCYQIVGHAPSGGVCLHLGHDVDGVAEGGEAHYRFANVADVGDAGIHCGAQLKPGTVVCAVADRAQQIKSSLNGSPTILKATDAPDEERHHFVADELVDDRVVAHQGSCSNDVEPVQQRCEVSSTGPLAKPGGTTYVGEQDGDVDLGSTGGKRITAAGAQAGVVVGGAG